MTSQKTFEQRLRDFITLFKLDIEDSNIKFDIRLAKNVPSDFSIDTNRYFEILLHLIRNSLKHKTFDNPEISLLITYVAIKNASILRHGWKGYLTTEVKDNGQGIEEERQVNLFKTFKNT